MNGNPALRVALSSLRASAGTKFLRSILRLRAPAAVLRSAKGGYLLAPRAPLFFLSLSGGEEFLGEHLEAGRAGRSFEIGEGGVFARAPRADVFVEFVGDDRVAEGVEDHTQAGGAAIGEVVFGVRVPLRTVRDVEFDCAHVVISIISMRVTQLKEKQPQITRISLIGAITKSV